MQKRRSHCVFANHRQTPTRRAFWPCSFQHPHGHSAIICVRCTPELANNMTDIDALMMQYVLGNSQWLFKGKAVTYKPCRSLQECYPRCCVQQLTLEVQRHVDSGTWLANGPKRPRSWRDACCPHRVVARRLWVMGSECGLIIEVTDLMYDGKEEECPFPIDQPLL